MPSRSKCMECSAPPTYEARWAEGRARAWFCDKHWASWSKEHAGDIISHRGVKGGVVGKKYGEDPKTRIAKTIPRKGDRYHGSFYGTDKGEWKFGGYELGWRRSGWDWQAALGLSLSPVMDVDGATQHNQGFRQALKEMVREYPELLDFHVRFDGPPIPVRDLVGKPKRTFDWKRIKFLHGTSSSAWEKIQREGLRPRSETKATPAYGAHIERARPGRVDAVYLTTQDNMARLAARDAARKDKSRPVVLMVTGLDGRYMAPDEDSREKDPRVSLMRMGSVAYTKSIPARKIQLVQVWEDDSRRWIKVGAQVGTDTASIWAMNPESIPDVFRPWIKLPWGEWATHWEEIEQDIREHGGAVFNTKSDGIWDVQVHFPEGSTLGEGQVKGKGFLPPYNTPDFMGGNSNSIGMLSPQVRIALRYLESRKDPLTKAQVQKFRKEFLMIMRNVSRVKDIKTAEKLRRAIKKWAKEFGEFGRQIREDLKDRIRVWKNQKVWEREGDPAWAEYYIDNMKPFWDFQWEFRTVPEIPEAKGDDVEVIKKRLMQSDLDMTETEIDSYIRDAFLRGNMRTQEQAEIDSLTTWRERARKWENRTRRKARATWKYLADLIEWTERGGSYGGGKEPVILTRTTDELVQIAGFKVLFRGFDDASDYGRSGLETLKAALTKYRKRASRVFPWIIQHQLPIEVDWTFKGESAAATYSPRHITVTPWGITRGRVDNFVKTMAHEMGHHVWRAFLSGKMKDFWVKAIRGDYKKLDLRDILKADIKLFDKKSAREHPILYLQWMTLMDDPVYKYLDFLSQKDIREYLDGGGDPVVRVPAHPITGYAGKNPEEAFSEALGMLVAYGPKAVLGTVRGWLKILLPRLKLADDISIRVASRHRGRQMCIALGHMKQAGWWQINLPRGGDAYGCQDVPEEDRRYNGDGPADMFGDFLRDLDMVYRKTWGRPAYPEELREAFEFVFRPVEKPGDKGNQMWPLNGWVDVVSDATGLSGKAIANLPMNQIEKIQDYWRDYRNSGFQEGVSYPIKDGPPQPSREALQEFIRRAERIVRHTLHDHLNMYDIDPENGGSSIVTLGIGFSYEGEVSMKKVDEDLIPRVATRWLRNASDRIRPGSFVLLRKKRSIKDGGVFRVVRVRDDIADLSRSQVWDSKVIRQEPLVNLTVSRPTYEDLLGYTYYNAARAISQRVKEGRDLESALRRSVTLRNAPKEVFGIIRQMVKDEMRGRKVAKTTGDGSSVGLFIPLPNELARQFPSLGAEDRSPPHTTFLYIGKVPKEREKELVNVLQHILGGYGVIKARLGDLDSFRQIEKDRRVYFVGVHFNRDMGSLRDSITYALQDAGFEVANSFPGPFFAHTTLAYMDGIDAEYEGPVPKGMWEFDRIPVWGLSQPYEIELGTYTAQSMTEAL